MLVPLLEHRPFLPGAPALPHPVPGSPALMLTEPGSLESCSCGFAQLCSAARLSLSSPSPDLPRPFPLLLSLPLPGSSVQKRCREPQAHRSPPLVAILPEKLQRPNMSFKPRSLCSARLVLGSSAQGMDPAFLSAEAG